MVKSNYRIVRIIGYAFIGYYTYEDLRQIFDAWICLSWKIHTICQEGVRDIPCDCVL